MQKTACVAAFKWEGTVGGMLLERSKGKLERKQQTPWFHMKPEGPEETKLFTGLRHAKELCLDPKVNN